MAASAVPMLMPTLLLLPVLMTSSRVLSIPRDPYDASWFHIVAKLSTIDNQNPQQHKGSTNDITTGTRQALSSRSQFHTAWSGLSPRNEDVNSEHFRQSMSGQVPTINKRPSMADYIRNRWLLKGLLLKYNKDSLLEGGGPVGDAEQPIDEEGELRQDVSQEAGVGGWPMRYGRSV